MNHNDVHGLNEKGCGIIYRLHIGDTKIVLDLVCSLGNLSVSLFFSAFFQ